MIVPTIGPAGADIMLLGEAPGADEDATGLPFQGAAGRTLNNLLQQAGISRHSCLIANVARERPPGNNISLYFTDKQCTTPRPELAAWIQQLKDEITLHQPNIIIALGRTALWALTGETSISSMRGYLLETNFEPRTKVLPTFHPSAVNYDYKLHFTVIMDLRKALRHSISKTPWADQRRLHSSPSYSEFIQYLLHLQNERKPIAVDIETCQPGSHIHIMGIADSHNSAYSFEILKGHAPLYSSDMEARLWLELSKTLHDCPSIMHNGSYDAAVLMHLNGIYCKNFFFDTMIAAHVCWPETPRSLGYCSSLCLDVPPWKHTSQSLPTLYNAADAANTYGIYEVMKAEIERQGLQSVFEFEMSTIEPAIMLQLQGLYINPEKRSEIKEKAEARIAELESELESALGKKINFSSPKQLQTLLYIDLGLPVQYKRRKSALEERKITADAEALKKLNQKVNNPVLDKIMELKKLTKLTTGFLNVETSTSSRVHTCYNVTGATMARENKGFTVDDEDSYKSFGRWSSSKSIILPYGSGNLQNIPKKARKMYTAPEGHVFLQADYMQAEAVVVAYLINDITLKKLFQDSYGKSKTYLTERGMDVHKITAAMMFNVKPENVTPQQRTIGKTLRHATNYSAGPAVLANRLDCSVNEAKQLLRLYHAGCPQLQLWHGRIQDELKRTRTLYNLFGRKHYFLDRWGDTLFRSAYSYIPQSTVGDLMNKALVNLYTLHGQEIDIVLQLHDAIYCLVPSDNIAHYAQLIKQAMTIPLTHKQETFFIDVDFAVGPSWGDQEPYEIPETSNFDI